MNKLEKHYRDQFDSKIESITQRWERTIKNSLSAGGVVLVLAVALSVGTAYYNTRLQINENVLALQEQLSNAYKEIRAAQNVIDDAERNVAKTNKSLSEAKEGLDKAMKTHAESEKALKTTRSNLEIEQGKFSALKTGLERTNSDLIKAKEEFDKAKAKIDVHLQRIGEAVPNNANAADR